MDNLNVYTNNQMSGQSANQPVWEKIKNLFSRPKIVFIILGIIILVEAVYAIRVLTVPTPPPPSSSKAAVESLSEAKISLTTPKLSYGVGEVIPVAVTVNTGGRSIDGVDLIVRFDPKAVEVVPGSLIAGKIFSEYPLLSSDAKTGLISISGVSSINSSFTGQGEFALLSLRAKLSGRTSLVIDFQKDMTTASNLVEASTSKNILDTVGNLELTIQ